MVTLHRGRVILQLDGLRRYDPLAAFEKEYCKQGADSKSNDFVATHAIDFNDGT